MKTLTNVCRVLLFMVISISTGISIAQEKTIAQLQTELISPWLVTVAGEGRTRTLKITGATLKTDGTLLLEAVYGWTDAGQTAIEATASQLEQKSTLKFVTQSNSEVVATQTESGIFEGTFVLKNGTTKPIVIQKISEGELKQKVSLAVAARIASIIVKPAADVPASCASFSGEWTGFWGGGIGQLWLWVAAVDAKCMAKVAYLQHSRPPTGFRTAEIKDGALSVGCGGAGNNCIFTRHGDSLWATYSGTQGNNNAVFEKIQ